MVHAIDPDQKGKILWETRVGDGGPLGGSQWGSASDLEKICVAVSDVKLSGVADPKSPQGYRLILDPFTAREFATVNGKPPAAVHSTPPDQPSWMAWFSSTPVMANGAACQATYFWFSRLDKKQLSATFALGYPSTHWESSLR